MRCISKKQHFCFALCICIIFITILTGCGSKAEEYMIQYETEHFNSDLYEGKLYAKDLCVTSEDVDLTGFEGDPSLHAAGLFDVKAHQVLYADRIHEQLFPASTTKILTAYVALKYGKLSDVVTVSENATIFEPDAQLCGLMAGDQLTLYDLLCGLLLYSGNDNAVAIAEHISGSTEAFTKLMNQEALALGATNSSFVNAHGLHSEQHYTTVYDLYLIFQAALQNETFRQIIGTKSYEADYFNRHGAAVSKVWKSTNRYLTGEENAPEGITIIGGKTGTTFDAGNCLVLCSESSDGKPYISIVLKSDGKDNLYFQMSELLKIISN